MYYICKTMQYSHGTCTMLQLECNVQYCIALCAFIMQENDYSHITFTYVLYNRLQSQKDASRNTNTHNC